MKIPYRSLLAVCGVSAAALFVLPSGVAFTTIGGSLSVSSSNYQRDFRVHNDAADAAANNNNVPDPNYPGALGAVMAVWKGADAWASDTPGVNKNFDFDFQGEASSQGTSNDNILSWEFSGTCSGGVLAYMNPGSGGISNGWTIRFCEGWTWSDGPGNPAGGQIDLQGVAAHELGHALGLGHSNSGCGGSCSNDATMCPSICGSGTAQRDLATDDINGLGFIYGSAPANKPVITGISGNINTGGLITITGSNFASTVNVKFTAGTGQASGSIPGVVFNVPSTNGGTQVNVTIPTAAQDGNVFIWQPNTLLSNGFPIDIGQAPPSPPSITSVSPSSVKALGGELITVTGTGFTGATSVNAAGTILNNPPFDFTIVNDTTITFPAPEAPALGNATVTVTGPNGTSNPGSYSYVVTDPLTLVAPIFINNGGTASFKWGGKVNQTTFLSVSVTGATGVHNGETLLLPLLLIQLPNTDSKGLGSLSAPVNGATAGTVIFTQIWTLTGLIESTLEASNIGQTTVLF